MILKLYSIKDKLLDFTGPIGFKDDRVAKRMFESFLEKTEQEDHTDSKYWDLYCIGEFDNETGVIKGYEQSQIKLIMEGERNERKD